MTRAGRRASARAVPGGDWPERFFFYFLDELEKAGRTPEQISRAAWKPCRPEELKITGPDRDLSFHMVEMNPAEVERYLSRLPRTSVDVEALLARRRLVLVLLPGFTHHTLRYPAFYAQVEPLRSPLEVVKLARAEDGRSTVETFTHRGHGAKLVYAGYPRSNASSDVILRPLFRLLHESASLRRWVVDEGYRIVFVGYSYGAPLALELLAAMYSGKLDDTFLLPATEALLTINGAVHGSYLADFLVHPKTGFNVQKAVDLMRRFSLLGLPLGIRTVQEREDLLGGIRSLGHAMRRARLRKIIGQMPPHLKYISVSAFLPADDYDTNLVRNFDDASMYVQSQASRDISIYNDGQMVLKDTFLPAFPGVPDEHRINLGAVRAHHWAVSWRKVNFGNNNFPRTPYYRALVRTLHEAGIGRGKFSGHP
jgi:hypothetical protein